MTKFIKRQIQSITESPTLHSYGFFLSLTHLWTFLYWNKNQFFANAQSSLNSEPLCFPIFPNCDLWRTHLSTDGWQIVLYAYLALALACAISYCFSHLGRWSYWLLFMVSFFKLGLHLSNYNFMGNYHYMIHGITLAYLFLPCKETLIKYLLVMFYVAAGLLKLNIDWLSGAAMIKSPLLVGNLLVFSLYYVILLELIFVFGLLHQNRWARRLVLLQLFGFHTFSWHIVGFFYPLVMFSLLAIFFIDEWKVHKENKALPDHLFKFFNFKEPKTLYVLLIAFFILQVLPFLMVKDPSLSGAPRLSSLNMFDSKTECHPLLVVHKNNETAHLDRPLKNLGVRLKCDPLVFLNQAHQLCRANKKHKDFERLSFSLLSKRVTATHYKKVLDVPDVCALSNPLWAEIYSGARL